MIPAYSQSDVTLLPCAGPGLQENGDCVGNKQLSAILHSYRQFVLFYVTLQGVVERMALAMTLIDPVMLAWLLTLAQGACEILHI